MKVSKISLIHKGLYAHVCPLCGNILASASDVDFMPEFSICPCDRNGNKAPVYELFDNNGQTMIRRNKYPRFTARVTMDIKSDLDDVKVIDDNASALELAKAMRKAAEFLIKISKHDKTS